MTGDLHPVDDELEPELTREDRLAQFADRLAGGDDPADVARDMRWCLPVVDLPYVRAGERRVLQVFAGGWLDRPERNELRAA